VQGYIFGKPNDASATREIANSVRVEADGFACSRQPRHRLMRRAVAVIDGTKIEVKLRNISAMGAMVESHMPVSPGAVLAIDIVGVGPVRGLVRWAQSGKFGVEFEHEFDLGRLAPKKERRSDSPMVTPRYLSRGRAS
jgi:hypothetical protein